MPLWTGRIRDGARPDMIAAWKGKGISFGVEMAGTER
jgi:hypothetical protein